MNAVIEGFRIEYSSTPCKKLNNIYSRQKMFRNN